jgi:hypothetical protein
LYDIINTQKHTRSLQHISKAKEQRNDKRYEPQWLFCTFESAEKVGTRQTRVKRTFGTFTLADSNSPYSFMFTILPVSPLIPHDDSPLACFA